MFFTESVFPLVTKIFTNTGFASNVAHCFVQVGDDAVTILCKRSNDDSRLFLREKTVTEVPEQIQYSLYMSM